MAETPSYDQIHPKPEKALESDIQSLFDQAYGLLLQAAKLSRERGQAREFNWEFNTRIRHGSEIDAETVSIRL